MVKTSSMGVFPARSPIPVIVPFNPPHPTSKLDITFAVAKPEQGRFRAFLLTSLRHFLADQWNKSKARKRGGGRMRLSLDFESPKSRVMMEPADEQTPERLYDRQWAITLLDLT